MAASSAQQFCSGWDMSSGMKGTDREARRHKTEGLCAGTLHSNLQPTNRPFTKALVPEQAKVGRQRAAASCTFVGTATRADGHCTFPSIFLFSSVAQSCPTLCDPMNCSMPGLPVHHHLPEFTQTHVHPVSDAIQPSHPLSSPSPAPNPSQHQSLFQ